MFFYNLILNLLLLPLLPVLAVISLFNVRLRRTFLMRIGLVRIKKNHQSPVWFHCSSLGEFNAVKNIIDQLKVKYEHIFITTLSDTGYSAAVHYLGRENVSILPLDFNFLVKRFIKTIKPCLLVIEETEVWPNLIFQSVKSRVPVLYTNCIISNNSYRKYKFFQFIFKKVFASIDYFFIQKDSTKNYLERLGVPPEKVGYTGNIKFDINLKVKENSIEIKQKYDLTNKFILTCGSTRQGEEEFLLNVYRQLSGKIKDFKLILVPRHLSRVDEIVEYIKNLNLKFSLYSQPVKDYDVFLVDKMGVLLNMYEISDVTFIGGTLVPIGGHNPLEAAYFKKPVFSGKYIKNNREAFEKIIHNAGGYFVNTVQEFAMLLEGLYSNRNKLEKMGENGYKILKDNQGASHRIVEHIIQKYVPS